MKIPERGPSLTDAERDDLARDLARIASRAAIAVMKVYSSEFEARYKSDHSPVSDADELAEAIILEDLARLAPDIPVVAEESADRWRGGAWPSPARFFLVDPVDGTREFVKRNGQFTVNIALLDEGAPVVGVIYAPALGEMVYAGAHAVSLEGIAPGERLPAGAPSLLRVRAAPEDGLTAMVSHSHGDRKTEAFLEARGVRRTDRIGSSLKFCRVAQGRADLYPRFGPTREWDVAAGHAILSAAGGCVTTADGAPFRYGKSESDFTNGPFVAWGGPRPF